MLRKTYILDETPGSISNIYEIKILICRILSKIKTKITKEQLISAVQLNETVNYFNFCHALKELIKSKHLLEKTIDGKNFLYLTSIGEETAKILNNNLPKHMVDKNVKIVEKFIEEEKENRNRKIYINKKEDGYYVKLIIEETKSNLLNLELFCPNSKLAEKAKKELKKKTTDIYKAVVAIISNDRSTLLKIASDMKK